jgi:hypothetical protein
MIMKTGLNISHLVEDRTATGFHMFTGRTQLLKAVAFRRVESSSTGASSMGHRGRRGVMGFR